MTTTESPPEVPTVKLAAIVAVEKGVKQRTERDITDRMRLFHNTPLMNGLMRTYQPVVEGGDPLPPEKKLVQIQGTVVLDEIAKKMANLIDVVATRETGNTKVRADVVVDGQTIVRDVPVTMLLALQKQVQDVIKILRSLPLLDPTKQWTFDSAQGVWITDPIQTAKTEKGLENHVKHPGTPDGKVQPQIETFTKDTVVGHYTKIEMSGAFPVPRVSQLVERAEKLLDAVKFARETCNAQEVEQIKMGDHIFKWLLAR